MREINTGVPQGSVLAPILFLLFENDMCRLEIGGEITSFADDMAVVFAAGDTDSQIVKTTDSLRKLGNRFDLNGQSKNASKSNYNFLGTEKSSIGMLNW